MLLLPCVSWCPHAIVSIAMQQITAQLLCERGGGNPRAPWRGY